MLFVIDIDGTIAEMNVPKTIEMYVQEFHLQIAPTRLENISFGDFMKLEELVAYRCQVGEEQFQAKREQIHQHPDLLSVLTPFEYAIKSIKYLSHLGNVRYYTIRKGRDDKAIREATMYWLAFQRFSNSDDIVFCQNFRAKLVNIWREPDAHLIFIDDQWENLIRTFGIMAEDPNCKKFVQDLRDRLTIVAFGTSSMPKITNGLKVVTLPSWVDIADIYPLFA